MVTTLLLLRALFLGGSGSFVQVVEDVEPDPQRVDLMPQPKESLVDFTLQMHGDPLVGVIYGLNSTTYLTYLK